MTPYQSQILAHLIWMAQTQKAYAWAASKRYAEIDPYQLSEMPHLLTQEMHSKQSKPITGQQESC